MPSDVESPSRIESINSIGSDEGKSIQNQPCK
jgi:hypothetical protein